KFCILSARDKSVDDELREPNAHAVGTVGAVKDENAVTHDACPLRLWKMQSNHAAPSHARPSAPANEADGRALNQANKKAALRPLRCSCASGSTNNRARHKRRQKRLAAPLQPE